MPTSAPARLYGLTIGIALAFCLFVSSVVVAPPSGAAEISPDVAASTEAAIAALEAYADLNGTYNVPGGYANGGFGWFEYEQGDYSVSIAQALVNAGTLSVDNIPRDPSNLSSPGFYSPYGLLVSTCGDRVAVFAYGDYDAVDAADREWWSANDCSTYPIDRGHGYFTLSKPLPSRVQASAGVVAATQTVVEAFEAYAEEYGTYNAGGGYLGLGFGWFEYERREYVTSIANALVSAGYLDADNIPRDPKNNARPGFYSPFGLLVSRCADRVAVFAKAGPSAVSEADRIWWEDNNCSTYFLDRGHKHFTLSKPLSDLAASPTATPVPTAVADPTATATPAPTSTPVPTATSVPTPTPQPTVPPGPLPPFACTVEDGQLAWTNHYVNKYWVYRSVDDGLNYEWIGRTLGATSFTDPSPVEGARYQVHYQGIPREECQEIVVGAMLFDGPAQTGATMRFPEGVFVGGASSFGGLNDQASSLTVMPGYIVMLCTEPTGSGSCRGFTNSKDDLGEFGLDDAVSYVQVRKLGESFELFPGNDLNQLVNRLPAEMGFILKPGVYLGASIFPKDDTSFVGEPGAILDGAGSSSPAFSGPGDRVEIRNLEIRNYTGLGHFTGAINARDLTDFGTGGEGWIVEDNNIHSNSFAGISVDSGMIVRNNDIHNNGQVGISGVADAANPLFDLLITGNRVYENVDGTAPQVLHEGGMKFVGAQNSVISDNVVSDNGGMGIWCDIDCDNVLIDGNSVSGNTMYYDESPGYGIFYEISTNGTIQNNIVEIEFDDLFLINCCGIVVGEAQSVVVQDNEITVSGLAERTFTALGVRQCCPGVRPDPSATFLNNTVNGDGVVVNIGSVTYPELFPELDTDLDPASFTFTNNTYLGDYVLRFNDIERTQEWWNETGWDVPSPPG